MSKYIPEKGDVVLWNGITMVVVDMKSHEDLGSLCYDREYFLCKEELLHDKDVMTQEELDKSGTWVQVQGHEFPEFSKTEKVFDITPYVISCSKVPKRRRKREKAILPMIFE